MSGWSAKPDHKPLAHRDLGKKFRKKHATTIADSKVDKKENDKK